MTVKFTLDTSAINKVLQQLDNKVTEAIRPAAQAAAQVLYDEAKRNADRIPVHSGKLSKAIYQAFSEKQSTPGHAVYEVSWNPRKAPHAHLVEFGHIQRYATYIGSDGQYHTRKRAGVSKRKPSKNASQAVKDAYYVLRPGGMLQVAAQPFMRPARAAFPAARAAAAAKLLELVKK
jgi:HK97 gp10 family phage protein